jgi:hypothetical protein
MNPAAAFRRLRSLIVGATLLGVAVIAGLSVASGGPDVTRLQQQLRLSEEPKDVQQVLAVQKSFVAGRSKPNAETTRGVVISGQIGGMSNLWPEQHPKFPWYEGQASFFLVDSKIASQFAAHAKHHGAGHNCAFCQALAEKNATAIAVVNFVDEKGEIIRTDARELLGLKENQTVIVRGKAKLLGGAMLVIDADGVYTKAKE